MNRRFVLMRKILTSLLSVAIAGSFALSANAAYDGSGTFKKITSLSAVEAGYYVIADASDAFVMTNAFGSKSFLVSADIAKTGADIVNPGVSIVWRFDAVGSNFTVYSENAAKYLAWDDTTFAGGNYVYLSDTNTNDYEQWSLSVTESIFSMSNVKTTARLLQYNSSAPRFACYTGSQKNLVLYKYEALPVDKVSSPSFDPAAGSYYESVSVSMTCSTPNAVIRYTLDGTTPTSASPTYSAPISITLTKTVKAYATLAGKTDSDVSSAVYTILPKHTGSVADVVSGADNTVWHDVTGVITSIGGSGGRSQFTMQAGGKALFVDKGNQNYSVGDEVKILEGRKTTYASYGIVQFAPTDAVNGIVLVTAGKGVPAPVEYTAAEFIAAPIADIQSSYVRIKNLKVTDPLPANGGEVNWVADSATAGNLNYVACDSGDANTTFTLRFPSDLGPGSLNVWKTKVRPVKDVDCFHATGVAAAYNNANQLYLDSPVGTAAKFDGPFQEAPAAAVCDWSLF